MNKTTKRYLISSVITFLSVFLPTMGFAIGSVDAETAITSSTVVSILVLAVRAGIKAVAEAYLVKVKK